MNSARSRLRAVSGLLVLLPGGTALAGTGRALPGPLAQTTAASYAFDILILLVLTAAAVYVVCKSSRRN